jgi:AcrR family transcriptional regulator
MARALSTEKRERFLTAALKLFVANGIQNTSTAEISREAGTAAGTLFLYFPTKQDLIDELVLWIAKKEAAVINGLLTPSLSVRETFFIIWDGSIRWLLENMDAYRYSQQVRDSSLVTPEVAQESGKYFAFYYDAIQKGLETGLLKPYPADLIGGFLYQDIVATMDHLRAQSDPQKLAQTIQQGFDLFWDGISISK